MVGSTSDPGSCRKACRACAPREEPPRGRGERGGGSCSPEGGGCWLCSSVGGGAPLPQNGGLLVQAPGCREGLDRGPYRGEGHRGVLRGTDGHRGAQRGTEVRYSWEESSGSPGEGWRGRRSEEGRGEEGDHSAQYSTVLYCTTITLSNSALHYSAEQYVLVGWVCTAVKPRKGSALLLFDVLPSGQQDSTSEFTECQVAAGERWVASKFVAIQRYSQRRDPAACVDEHEQVRHVGPIRGVRKRTLSLWLGLRAIWGIAARPASMYSQGQVILCTVQ